MTTFARWTSAATPLVLLLGGCTLSSTSEPQPTDQTTLSKEGLNRAVALARHELESEGAEDATITSATVTAEQGSESNTNTGYVCSSGRLLHIKLIGTFPHAVTTGYPVDPTKPGLPPDFTVHVLVLTGDAASGRACQAGVQTGDVTPQPNATVLNLD